MADFTNNPNTAPADWLQRMRPLLDQNKWGDLISHLSMVIPTLEDNSGKIFALQVRGFAYKQIDKCDHAIDDYSQAIELAPNDALARNRRGDTYAQKGEYNLAIADYSKAIELKPDYATAFGNRGDMYSKKAEHDSAINDYTQAIELEPNNALMHALRGYAHTQKGDYNKAIADWETAIELDPSNKDMVKALRLSIETSQQLLKSIHTKPHPAPGVPPEQALAQLREQFSKLSTKQVESHQQISKEMSAAIAGLREELSEYWTVKSERLRKELSDFLSAEAVRLRKEMSAELSAKAEQLREHTTQKFSSDFGGVKEFKRREGEHNEAQKRAGARSERVLWALFVFYLVAFIAIGVYLYCKTGTLTPKDILPWIPVVFLTSSPAIWAVRILNRERTRHFALRENAYASQLMTVLLFLKPTGKHEEELFKKFFDHHSLHGSPQLVVDLENKPKTDDGIVWQVLNLVRRNGGKSGGNS